MRVLVFGASITQGFYDTQGGWAERLWTHYTKNLLSDSNGPDITIFNLGISGNDTPRLLKRFQPETDARKFPGEEFAFVFFIGTNDSWVREDGSEISTPEKFSGEIRELINQAKQYSAKVMFVGLAPCDEARSQPIPWNKDIFFSNARISDFDKAIKDVCQQEGVNYVPIFDSLKKQLDNKEDIYADGLHPNDAGHQLIFELVRPKLDNLLNT